MRKKLDKLLGVLEEKSISGNTEVYISGIAYDSRYVKPGFLFVAISGYKEDGNVYVEQAIKAGAVAVVTSGRCFPGNAAIVKVTDSRHALSALSEAFYNSPSDKLNIIGITGTNGKTTVSYLLEAIFKAKREKVGVFGTIEYRMGKKIIPAANTTPQSLDLNRMFYGLVKDGFSTAVIEVSSHALVQSRVEGIEFDATVFTNLTRDHIDFHKSMEEYLEAKSLLFSCQGKINRKQREKIAVINIDDPVYSKIRAASSARVISFGINNQADIMAENIKFDISGSSFYLKNNMAGTGGRINLSIAGQYNVCNALAAAAVAAGQGIKLTVIKRGLEKVKSVPGRFETVKRGQQFTVIVDYAHTDDSLRRLLESCKHLQPNRIITVFGCGGDRDRGKRPMMGEAAVLNSDYVMLTSDNPRSEDPEKIILDIETGARKTGLRNYQIIIDREEAINRAIRMADKGDIVVLAGKGHEDYQIIGDSRLYFDDRKVAANALSKLGYNGKNNRR